MAVEKTTVTTKEQAHSFLQNISDYSTTFGGDLSSFFKPFRSRFNVTGIPHYRASLWQPSGGQVPNEISFVGADSSGLNPYGIWTLNEGILHGANRSTSVDTTIDANDVRTFGLKTPMTFVGPGFDIFGYPSPNYASGWENGFFTSAAPSGKFLAANGNPTNNLRDVPYGYWNAGPMDLRWDQIRKVWRAPIGVYPAHISAAYSGTTLITDLTATYLKSVLRYDAIVYDGVANQIRVTGVQAAGPREATFFVSPFTSGTFCFIVHDKVNNRPDFSIYGIEEPAVVDCSSSANVSDIQSIESIASSDQYLMFNSLLASPLDELYGGTGFGSYTSGQILLGSPTGSSLIKRGLLAGSGIEISGNTSNIFIRLSTGVAFISAGINNTITELQGITTPLNIAQGGTAATGKVFLDLTTSQVAGGTKSFTSGVRTVSGTLGQIGYGFTNDSSIGINAIPGRGIGIIGSGVYLNKFSPTGSYHYTPLVVYPNIDALISTALPTSFEVREINGRSSYGYLQRWTDQSSTIIYGSFDNQGQFSSRSLVASGQPTGIAPLLSLYRASGYSALAPTIYASGDRIGEYFSISSSGNKTLFGQSGYQTQIFGTTGNTINSWPTGNGQIALLNDVNYIKYRGIASNSDVLQQDGLICVSGVGPFRLNLFDATGLTERRYIFTNKTTKALIIGATGISNINGATGFFLSVSGTVSFISDGNNWISF